MNAKATKLVIGLDNDQGPLLLTWFNFNPSMDKQLHAQ